MEVSRNTDEERKKFITLSRLYAGRFIESIEQSLIVSTEDVDHEISTCKDTLDVVLL